MTQRFLRRASTAIYRALKKSGITVPRSLSPHTRIRTANSGRWINLRQALVQEAEFAARRSPQHRRFTLALLNRIETIEQHSPRLPVTEALFGDGSELLLDRDKVLTAPNVEPHPDLNDTQNQAIEKARRKKVLFIWGAPGTGKTLVLTTLLREQISNDQNVLICCQTKTALNLVLNQLSTDEQSSVTAKTLDAAVIDDAIGLSHFDTVVLDEANMAGLPYVLFLSALARQQLILIGDPAQLPPIVSRHTELTSDVLTTDIFWHQIASPTLSALYTWQEQHHENAVFLKTQYGTPLPIFSITNQLYYGNRLVSVEPSKAKISYIDTSTLNPDLIGRKTSPINPTHAEIAAEEAAWMLQRRRESMEKKIGVISPFHEQQKHLSQVFKTRGLPETIDIGTVHTFQGQHKPFLILDLTVSSVDHTFINLGGTLEADSRAARLLNTALSRCRADTSGGSCQLVVIANHQHITTMYPDSALLRFVERVKASADKLIEPDEAPNPLALGAYTRNHVSRFKETTDALINEVTKEHASVNEYLSSIDDSDNHPVTILIEKYCQVIARLMQLCDDGKAPDGKAVFRRSAGMRRRMEELPITALALSDLSEDKRYASDREIHFKEFVSNLYILIYESSMRQVETHQGTKRMQPPAPMFDPDAVKGESYGRIRLWVRELRNHYQHDTADWPDIQRRNNDQRVTEFFIAAIDQSQPESSIDYLSAQLFIMAEVVRYLKTVQTTLVHSSAN